MINPLIVEREGVLLGVCGEEGIRVRGGGSTKTCVNGGRRL